MTSSLRPPTPRVTPRRSSKLSQVNARGDKLASHQADVGNPGVGQEVQLCAWCGVRPVAKARTKKGDFRRHRTRYCKTCRPIARQALDNRRRQKRQVLDPLEAISSIWIDDPCTGRWRRVRARSARLGRLGPDYLTLKLPRNINPDHLNPEE